MSEAEKPKPKQKARLIMTVSLLMDVDAEGVDAYAIVKDYENLILSQEWFSKNAPAPISLVAEDFYMSRIQFVANKPNATGIKLG